MSQLDDTEGVATTGADALDDSPSGWCLHCKMRNAARPRGLCSRCFGDLKVREQYSIRLVSYRANVGIGTLGYELPSQPTRALPGTHDKLRVLQERAARGECLWHPRDAVWGVCDALDRLARMLRPH